MRYLIICSLFLSCNVVKTLTSGDTSPSNDFFDNCNNCGNHEIVELNNGLVSFFKLDESSTTRVDSGYSGNDLSDFGVSIPTINQSGRQSMDCNSYVSATEYVYKSGGVSNLSFGNGGDFSIAFWIYRLTDPSSDMYILKTDNLEILSPNWDNASIQVKVGGLQTSSALGLGMSTWDHVVINYSRNDGFTIYFNGNYYHHDSTPTSSVNVNTTFIYLCSNSGGTNKFEGYLDSFGVWDRLLNPSEVKALYNGNNDLD